MNIQSIFQNIIKVSTCELEKYQFILEKCGYSLDEITDYDDGRTYQKWSTKVGVDVILDIQQNTDDRYGTIVSEIIDCWVELRAIRNALEVDKNDELITVQPNTSAQTQLMEKISDWEKEIREDEAMYKMMIKGEIDTAIVAYYLLDKEAQKAVLQ